MMEWNEEETKIIIIFTCIFNYVNNSKCFLQLFLSTQPLSSKQANKKKKKKEKLYENGYNNFPQIKAFRESVKE